MKNYHYVLSIILDILLAMLKRINPELLIHNIEHC